MLVALCVLMLTIPFNAVMEDSCSKPSDKGVFFQGKVTGGAQSVYVTLQERIMFNSFDSVPVCESSSCETRVKHVRTKTMHDDEQRFEFWEPDMELIPRVYRLIFGRENYTQVILPIWINNRSQTICSNGRKFHVGYAEVKMRPTNWKDDKL